MKSILKTTGRILMFGLLTVVFILVLGYIIPRQLASQQQAILSETSGYPAPIQEKSDAAYPVPGKTDSSPTLEPTRKATLPPIWELPTMTGVPVTPFPTLTLQPGPQPTSIPLVIPAQDASGGIYYVGQKADGGGFALFGVSVDRAGKAIAPGSQVMEYDIPADGFIFPSFNGKGFVVTREWGLWDIYIQDDKGEYITQSFTKGGEAIFFNWFPDNQKFLWGEGALILEDLITGLKVRLVSVGYGKLNGAAASPDGQYVVFSFNTDVQFQAGLWIEESNGQNMRLLSGGAFPSNISWSPDGKQIIFWGRGWEIINADGSNRHQVANEIILPQCSTFPPLWSPDSRTVAVRTSKTGISFCHGWGKELFEDSNIFLIDVASGQVRPLLTDGSTGNIDPAWSPDGSQIAFVSNRSGNPEIWIVNVDGTNLHPFTNSGFLVRYPIWRDSQ